jgi:hypothetical protein
MARDRNAARPREGRGEAVVSALHCPCGRRFYPMGVGPGQLAKCPACGAWRRVPEAAAPETVADAVRRASAAQAQASGRRRRGRSIEAEASLGRCLLYPLRDGPGVAMLVAIPPFFWIMSVPAFDIIRILSPGVGREFNPIAAFLVWSIALPLILSFVMVLGYILLFLGGVLVASAMGEDDHPSWPTWDYRAIVEGLGRWGWALVFGFGLGAFPTVAYWVNCGDIDLFDRIVFADLLVLGAGYTQMALAAALLHNTLLAANPWTVLQGIWRLGWAYLEPCLVAGGAVILALASLYGVLFRAPSLQVAAIGLWAWWVFALYAAMVVLRLLGLTYYRHADALGWFRARPRWAVWGRQGTIYTNS